MVTIYFTRQFVGGPLKGLRHNDSITVSDVDKWLKWADQHRTAPVKPVCNGSPYVIVDRSFQKYWRE